ncbi:MAG: MFS transporter, partial [Verrucomicrobiota bacterium]
MSRKPALAFIFVTLVLDILGIGLIVPILPALVEDLSGKGPADGARLYGALASVYALMQFLFAPLLGNLSDRFGRRRVILISLFGSAFDYCLMAWSPTLLLFFVGRVLSGISGANMAPATAYIADISPPEKRAANFGLIGAAFGLGFVLGPFLGGHLGEIHVRLPFWVAGGLSLLNAAYGFFVLPESLAKENRRSLEWQKANPLGMLQQLWRYPVVLG